MPTSQANGLFMGPSPVRLQWEIQLSYVNLGWLSAGGPPSLPEHKRLLYTFIAFGYKT